LLNLRKAEYLLIGGYAVGYYGYPRATADMDIWVARAPRNAAKLVQALRDFGFALPDLKPELFLRAGQIIRLGEPPLRIELLTSISGVEFEECYRTRTRARIDGLRVNLISLHHLKQNKAASGRAKDLADLERLQELS
jgi:hypothetical protein